MEAGLLWFDDDSRRDLGAKIAAAAQRYEQKFGRQPNVCYVNPMTLNGASLEQDGVKVLAAQHIPPHHFWLGVQRKR